MNKIDLKLYNGDCLEVMDALIEEGVKVDLTVTSPPYDNLRSYNGNSEMWNKDVWKRVIEKLYDITSDGGVVVWVVGDATVKGSETGTSFEQALYFKEVGFNIHDTMIYEKVGLSFPDSNRYYQMFEYMFVLSKGKPKTFNPLKDRRNVSHGRNVNGKDRKSDGGFKKRTGHGNIIKEFGVRFNIWRIPNQKRGIKHPAPFPVDLAQDHIMTWSNENDTVLDCFMGSGTTGVACKNLNRDFIGIELDEEYFNIAKERTENT